MFMTAQKGSEINVTLVGEDDLPQLDNLVHSIVREEAPGNQRDEKRAGESFRQSIERCNIGKSDSAWILLASVSSHPVGMATLVRTPKLDHRIGFLYLDEFHVLEDYRRRGVGTALMTRAFELAKELGLVGIRLLTRPANLPAQRFYEQLGFTRHPSILYESRIAPPEGSGLESDR